MATTYELLTDAGKLLAAIEDADGEITEESIGLLEDFLAGSSDKLGAINAVIIKSKAEISAHKVYRDKHVNRIRSLTKAIERVTNLGTGMLVTREELGEEPKVKAEWGSVSLRTTYVTTVAENLDDVDVRYLVEQPPKVDKAAAKKAIQAGELVAGITLTENRKAVWR